jgi:hypothetical protein
VDAGVEARDDELDHLAADTGRTARERSGEQQHDGARLDLGERRADTAGVAQHEVALQRGPLLAGDHHVLQLAHAGRDPVDRRRRARDVVHEASRLRDTARRLGAERDARTLACDGGDILQRQRPTVEDDGHGAQPRVSSPAAVTAPSPA